MKKSLIFLTFLTLVFAFSLQFRVQAAPPVGPFVKHLSSLLKWTRSSSKAPHSDGNVLQFENGYLVETVVEGNELGVVPYSIRVAEDGELFAVDAVNSNIVRITPPLSQYSRARLVAGSFQGHLGHVDGKPSDARFNGPKGVTMDDKGNVYVADTSNLAIRKIGDSGVTTIAGGKSTVAGYRDGPSEDAQFSSDFDVVYVRPTCSLLVVDRGNAALRQISLNQEDCDYQYNSISATGFLMAENMPVNPVVLRVDNVVLFSPNFWGDRFLTYTYDDAATCEGKEQRIEELKEEVRNELKASAGKSTELLKLINSIQLLGLAYHFEKEIEEALKDMHGKYDLVDDNENLTNASLRFRLLRQEGHLISSDVFNKFKDKEGNFKESLIGDSPGLLALYEATHLMVHGEDILEEALAFTTTHLQSIVTDHPNNPLAKQVIHALKRPIRKGLTRVEARHGISIYQQDDSHNKSLLKLAKLDFNLLQSLHRKELQWWKGLDLARKLHFARDRLVESYFWAMGVCFEPQYFLSREFFTKMTAIIAITDDIYDAYGTIEELELLTMLLGSPFQSGMPIPRVG